MLYVLFALLVGALIIIFGPSPIIVGLIVLLAFLAAVGVIGSNSAYSPVALFVVLAIAIIGACLFNFTAYDRTEAKDKETYVVSSAVLVMDGGGNYLEFISDDTVHHVYVGKETKVKEKAALEKANKITVYKKGTKYIPEKRWEKILKTKYGENYHTEKVIIE